MAVITKLYILNEGFDELGLAGYVFNLSPNDQMAALRKLDALVATWEAQGLTINWGFSTDPNDSTPNDEVTIPDSALTALTTALAVRLAPSYGKTVSQDTKMAAAYGLNALRTQRAVVPQQQFPDSLPIGAGNQAIYQKYFKTDDTLNSNGGSLTL